MLLFNMLFSRNSADDVRGEKSCLVIRVHHGQSEGAQTISEKIRLSDKQSLYVSLIS